MPRDAAAVILLRQNTDPANPEVFWVKRSDALAFLGGFHAFPGGQIDPTDAGGQFADRGSQYHTAIFYHDEGQRKDAEYSKKELNTSGVFDKPVVTEIRPAGAFYPAEDYHQDYHKTCPLKYKLYRAGSGRDRFIEQIWDKKNKQEAAMSKEQMHDAVFAEQKKNLTPLQREVKCTTLSDC